MYESGLDPSLTAIVVSCRIPGEYVVTVGEIQETIEQTIPADIAEHEAGQGEG